MLSENIFYSSVRLKKMILETNDITFRKLQEEDLQSLFKWLNTDFVIEWY